MKSRTMFFAFGILFLAAIVRWGVMAAADPTTAPSDTVHPVCADGSLDGYKLTFSDEFNGDSLNKDVWDCRTDSKGLSAQLPDNVSVSDGLLHIALKKQTVGIWHHTGGGVVTRQEFQYGYYECRMKIPPGRGWHTSFWTAGYSGGGKPASKATKQEIDIVEQDSVDHYTYSAGVIAWANHAAGYGRKHPRAAVNLSQDFHVWGMEFTPEVVRFFFDGKMTHEADATKFTQGPQHIWLTSIGYPTGGSIDDSKLPAEALFDWVRFYEKQ